MDHSLPGTYVHGISQVRILEWGAISFSRRSSQPRDETRVSCLAGGFFTTEPPGKPFYTKQEVIYVKWNLHIHCDEWKYARTVNPKIT